jgi:hypothetical protein
MRQLLDLRHHRHTGKLLHHEHTSYRALAFIFAVAGLCMLGLNVVSHVAAANFGISAVVNVPVPSNPPIISSPVSNAATKNGSVLITGSCPLVTPQVVVSITVDDTPAGTGICDSNNDFSVPITIGAGTHTIKAGVVTVSGQLGPVSTPVTIISSSNTQNTLVLNTDQSFIYANSKNITWNGTISGDGQGADYVHIDWGDDSESNYTVKTGAQSFNHYYATLASHNILIDVSSASGNLASQQFADAAYTTYTAPTPPTQQGFLPSSTIIGLYGLYVTTVAVAGVIWLEAKHTRRQHATG